MATGEINNTIKEKLEKARKELLDLGFRNHLINYRELKTKGIHIIDELSEQLYEILVLQGKTMYFLSDPTKDQKNGESQELDFFDLVQPENDDDEKVADRHKDNKIQTPHSSKRLQRRLLNTYYTARTHIQERGVNVLYLALGMLHWYEDENSEKLRRSPLILVPIEISRSDAQSKFKVRYTGEEVGGNLSLQAKFKMDFGLEIPIPEETEEINISKYFQSVSKKIRNQKRWKVEENEQGIGFFSFNKFLMYNDLDHENWPEGCKPSQNKIIQSVLEEGFSEPDPIISKNDHIDEFLDPKDLNQVVDADSSQIIAISDVNQGRNLVIQGPPGTGKSQTITNIIAEAIALDKRVLFVSEKMAALEVVKRKLDDVGLGMACLELHSHKSNKKSFLAELEKTLNLDKPVSKNGDFDIEALKKNRDELNRYCFAVNEVMGKSGVTPFQAYGKILKIKNKLGAISSPKIERNVLLPLDQSTFRRRLDSIEKLEAQIKRIGRPIDHPFWGSNITVHIPSHNDEIKSEIETVLDCLDKIRESQNDLSVYFGLSLSENWQEGKILLKASEIALKAPKNIGKVAIQDESWIEKQQELKHFIDTGQRITELKSTYGSRIINEAWGEEVLEIRKSLVAKGDKWWRFFSRDYWRAKNALAGLMVEKLPKELETQLDLVGAILEYQRLEPILKDYEELGEELFQDLYNGEKSSWENLKQINEWLFNTHTEILEEGIPSKFLSFFDEQFDKEKVHDKKESLKKEKGKYTDTVRSLFDRLKFDDKKRFDGEGFWSQDYITHSNMFEIQLSNVEKLSEVSSLNHGLFELKEEGLQEVEAIACEWKPAGNHLGDLFELNWLEAFLEKTLKERKELSGFSSESHWRKIKKFRDLDEQLLRQNRAELAYKHWENLPDSVGLGEVGLLKKEFNKKRRHLPIRQLIEKAGNAIQAIKPVFMMSPLSVSTYLPPGTINFDLVIFDEASQVRPVDAFSPLLRADQAVVVGDSKQLPPTSFFDVELELEDEEEQSQAADMESILGLFEGMGAPSRMLRWHYRSEHESLIAVSNYEFYNNDLVLFPSPDVERNNTGIKYHYLSNTYYEPGRGKSYNRLEAKAVARAVLDHAQKNSGLSLGVAAFSKSQMKVIQDELEILRRKDSSYEYFFNAHPEEPFFIKNLENVQGDERDIILISIGYGKTEDGYVSMNFGPLNHDGGERRLNVLITRARKRCEIFTNLLPQDIDTNRTQAKGMIALKRYLKYARTGELDLPKSTDKEADSLFEEDVAHELRQHGYEIEHQVGSAGFLIDLGVLHPENSSEFILGIECDGASYHSAKSARDRDRIRQQVLERIGWTIYRIWSTDWFKNKEKEVGKLLQKIDWLLARKDDGIDKDAKEELSELQNPSFTRISEENPIKENLSNPYQTVDITNVTELTSSYSHKYGSYNSYEALVEIISNVEAPIHKELLMKKVADHLGYGRLGRKIKTRILSAINSVEDKGVIYSKSEFIYSKNSKIKVRDRSSLTSEYREITHIAPEEIQKALLILIEKSFGAEEEDLIKESGALLGYSRITQNIYDVIQSNLEKLIEKNQVHLENNKVFINNEN